MIMAEDVLGVFPASEVWGLQRKRPCTLLLSQRRLFILKRDSSRNNLTKERVQALGIEAFEGGGHYALPLEDIRWVQINPSLLGAGLKIQTGGGGYRFRLSRGPSQRLERLLREILPGKVRRPGED
ncbi:MAG: hypothetical protein ACE5I4_07805 [Thermoplasmata archaeon]